MEGNAADNIGITLLRRLHALAAIRRERGDMRLFLSPNPEPQEFRLPLDESIGEDTGLVLEPREGASFGTRKLQSRTRPVGISAFCDGTRSTYFLGFDDIYPLLYTENAAAVRERDLNWGYHRSYLRIGRRQETLLAPFGLLAPSVRRPYEMLGLCPTHYADLCWVGDSEERGLTPTELRSLNSLGWQQRGQRRARRLMELSEQIATLAASRVLRSQYADGSRWLLKDGSLFQFDRKYLRQPDSLRQVVAAVKSHPVPFFGVAGERALAVMHVGERSVTFMPRPPRDSARRDDGADTLASSPRPMISWYLRVREPELRNPNLLSGVVRLDIAAVADWHAWVDPVSWAVLDEFYGLSARPDPRYDVMPYGIAECERFLASERLSGELLLAGLAQ